MIWGAGDWVAYTVFNRSVILLIDIVGRYLQVTKAHQAETRVKCGPRSPKRAGVDERSVLIG